MAKIRFSLWQDKRTSANDAPIYLVVSHGGKRATAPTGFRLPPKHWNPRTSEARKTYGSDGEWQKVNERLRQIQTLAEGVFVAAAAVGEDVTAAELRDRLVRLIEPEKAAAEDGLPDERPCFITYCQDLIATWDGRWEYQTYLAYRTAVKKLRGFWTGENVRQIDVTTPPPKRLPFEAVTPNFLRRMQTHLAAAGNTRGKQAKGNKANTLHKNLSTLKGFYLQAMEDELIPWGRNPFESLELRKEDAIKEKLSTEEIRRIKEMPIEEGSLLADVRRWFLFAFYAGGMRFSDVALARRKHVRRDESGAWRCHYRMGKTKGIHGALLVDDAIAILDYYDWQKKGREDLLFPVLGGYDLSTKESLRAALASRNALVNKYLGKLQKRAGIETPTTFHLSRHSVVGYLMEQGYDARTIMQVVGHGQLRTTEHYMKGFKSSGPDDALRALKL